MPGPLSVNTMQGRLFEEDSRLLLSFWCASAHGFHLLRRLPYQVHNAIGGMGDISARCNSCCIVSFREEPKHVLNESELRAATSIETHNQSYACLSGSQGESDRLMAPPTRFDTAPVLIIRGSYRGESRRHFVLSRDVPVWSAAVPRLAGEALLFFDSVHLQEVRDEHLQKVLQASGRGASEKQAAGAASGDLRCVPLG